MPTSSIATQSEPQDDESTLPRRSRAIVKSTSKPSSQTIPTCPPTNYADCPLKPITIVLVPTKFGFMTDKVATEFGKIPLYVQTVGTKCHILTDRSYSAEVSDLTRFIVKDQLRSHLAKDTLFEAGRSIKEATQLRSYDELNFKYRGAWLNEQVAALNVLQTDVDESLATTVRERMKELGVPVVAVASLPEVAEEGITYHQLCGGRMWTLDACSRFCWIPSGSSDATKRLDEGSSIDVGVIPFVRLRPERSGCATSSSHTLPRL